MYKVLSDLIMWQSSIGKEAQQFPWIMSNPKGMSSLSWAVATVSDYLVYWVNVAKMSILLIFNH